MAQGTGLVRALGEHSGFSAGERAGTSGVESGLGERSTETSETGRRRGGRVPESIVVEPRAFRAPVHRDEEHEHDHERDGDESPASTGHGHGVQRPETAAAAPAARPGALQERGGGRLKMHGEDVRNDDPRRGRGDVLLADRSGRVVAGHAVADSEETNGRAGSRARAPVTRGTTRRPRTLRCC